MYTKQLGPGQVDYLLAVSIPANSQLYYVYTMEGVDEFRVCKSQPKSSIVIDIDDSLETIDDNCYEFAFSVHKDSANDEGLNNQWHELYEFEPYDC